MKLAELKKETKLAIVIPCYNEEEVLPETLKRLIKLLKEMQADNQISGESTIWLVDDGSKDRTWQLICESGVENHQVRGIKLAKNRGHQHALLAGLENAEGDVLVSIDADLQDDVQVIKEMVDQYHKGFDIVYGVRSSRKTDTVFKRMTAQGFYWILQKLGVDVIYNHADYRLMSRQTIEALKQYEEVNLFLRGIIPSIGFHSTVVEYERAERFAGESKYPINKMLALAVDGITSFSAVPLRIIAVMGLLIFLASMAISVWAIYIRLFTDDSIPGWASSVLPMYVLGGVQLLSIGVLGEYVAKVYLETKKRPRYIIQKMINRSEG
ncbi:MAG: glycosyltransferase family 2 protein, partial [Gammaproteobacteria bacterium]|nr:glycosyltransferase family 2 protein [Gammaproteobacteria bacterium]